MDAELKQYLDTNFARIDQRFEEVDKRIDELEVGMKGHVEKIETSLLTAFHGWARPMEVRVYNVTTHSHGI